MINDYLRLARPQQWIKNGFIFFAIFFAKKIEHWPSLYSNIIAFIGFSLVASSVYCVNDILDAPADRLHPQKKTRPVASGSISVRHAYLLSLILLLAGFSVLITGGLSYSVCVIIFVYYVLSILYCLYLKHIPIVDVFILSAGFVIRVIVGGVSAGIILSHWIIIMTFLLSLFLAFAKRRDDVIIFNNTGH